MGDASELYLVCGNRILADPGFYVFAVSCLEMALLKTCDLFSPVNSGIMDL